MNNMKNLKLLSLCIVSMLVACSDDVDITGIMNPNIATTNVQSTRSLENSSDMLFLWRQLKNNWILLSRYRNIAIPVPTVQIPVLRGWINISIPIFMR